jgi:uncharacterized protein
VRKSSQVMQEETGTAAIQALFRTAETRGFRRVKVKYAGGEATLHMRLVHQLQEVALELARSTGIESDAVLLTNGLRLRAADADWCIANQVKVMLSLDGVGALHDALRSQRDGRGTFAAVQRLVDEVLLPRGLRPDVSMTVTGTNAHGAAAVAQWAIVERRLPLSFNLYRASPLSSPRADLELEQQAIIAGLRAAYVLIEKNLPTEPLLGGLLDHVRFHGHTHPCGVGENYVVVTPTGTLAQCHMRLDTTVNTAHPRDLVGQMQTGPIVNLTVDAKAGCRTCSFRYRCAGGCPLETHRVTGRWDLVSPHCELYKTLMPDVLRLEGLRLMKTHGFLH